MGSSLFLEGMIGSLSQDSPERQRKAPLCLPGRSREAPRGWAAGKWPVKTAVIPPWHLMVRCRGSGRRHAGLGGDSAPDFGSIGIPAFAESARQVESTVHLAPKRPNLLAALRYECYLPAMTTESIGNI